MYCLYLSNAWKLQLNAFTRLVLCLDEFHVIIFFAVVFSDLVVLTIVWLVDVDVVYGVFSVVSTVNLVPILMSLLHFVALLVDYHYLFAVV